MLLHRGRSLNIHYFGCLKRYIKELTNRAIGHHLRIGHTLYTTLLTLHMVVECLNGYGCTEYQEQEKSR
jgi:hypothetical protein